MTCELQSTLEDSGIEWPALRNHIPCMAHVIKLALGAIMSNLGVKDRTKSSEIHEHHQQFGENESIENGKSQRLQKEGTARINKLSDLRPDWAKIIETIHTSTYFECPETAIHKAENAWCIDYANTWSSKKFIHWQTAKIHIAVLPIMDVKTRWKLTVELLKQDYRLWEFTRESLQNPKFSEYRPLFTTQN